LERARAAALARGEERDAASARAERCLGVLVSSLLALALLFLRSGCVRLADVAPSSGAVLVFLLLGPPLSFTSARTEDGVAFVAACAAWMAAGAALAWVVVRRRASPVASLAIALVPPAAALAVTGGSLGASADPAPWVLVLAPAMGLVPGASAIGVALVEGVGALPGRRIRGAAPGGAADVTRA
jgi:hypothetical protein